MKKTLLTIAIVLGISICSFAQYGGGLFKYGAVDDETFYGGGRTTNEGLLNLPTSHGQTNDESAPLGSGALLLIGFGAAYVGLRRKNQK